MARGPQEGRHRPLSPRGGLGGARRSKGRGPLQAKHKSPRSLYLRGLLSAFGREGGLPFFHVGFTTGAGRYGLADKTRKYNHRQDIGQGIHDLHRNGQ